jgi:hypothetical protein
MLDAATKELRIARARVYTQPEIRKESVRGCVVMRSIRSSRAAITKAYGFDFPADLYRFWKITTKHGDALFECGVRLSGPFAILAGGKLDPEHRWPGDPPEFFTVAEGNTDGLHWGYVLHEPGVAPGYVTHFYAREGYPIEGGSPTLTHAIFEHVRAIREQMEEDLGAIKAIDEDDDELAQRIACVKKLEAVLRKEVGRAKRFKPKKESLPTLDGLGVRAPRGPLAKDLQKARDELARLPTEKQDRAVLFAVAAYEALGRPLLARTFEPRLKGIHRRVRVKTPPKIDNRVSVTMEQAMLAPKRVRILHLSVWDEEPKTPDLGAIASMTNLEELVLRGYRLPELPKSFSRLKKLRTVELFECKLSSIPRVLRSLKIDSLEIVQSVTVSRPKKELRVPRGFAIPTLRWLHLVGCGLRDVPPFVLAAKRLRFLSMDGNHLRTLPEAIGNLKALDALSVSENALSDLPASFSKLKKLTSLWMSENRFAAIPAVLLDMRKLDDLSVGKNPLTKNKDERAKAKKIARDVSFT